ncbi:oligoendopeptidase F [Alicyclobacillus cycloheptanicus]|uniref:Oligopeptidase F n=1 Tax=Alicyclobacillus cycloheptanicus TaxID=1457 RepID=A0ABT9XH90_9BACL|nr:oligoendopeptidase F [Alicyclobacillus cycloheptanicus]MDQ0189666.1 oligoendopeptidase F [Alicyclobacillus cycloheptanicus]WDL99965.1 oligoendopeptidase F [Alicyclobacillus cycloheptanicus]
MAEPEKRGAVPTRSEIADKYKWRLEDIYPNQEAWDKEAAEVGPLVEQLTALAGHLAESAETLCKAFQLSDQINERATRLLNYAHRKKDENNANSTYQALADRAMALLIQAESARAFFVPEVLQIPEDRIRTFLEEDEGLRLYKFILEDMFRHKPHVLSAAEERLLAMAGEMAETPSEIFTMFNDADTRFPMVKDEDGSEVELTHGRYSRLMESTKRDVRKGAFEALYGTYRKHINTLAATYAANVKKDIFYARARKYNSSREAALDDDNVPTSVYDNLIAAVHEALPTLHKYMELRKRVLGLDELHMYDLYTPLVPDLKLTIPYEEAVETVKAAIQPLGEDYVKHASEGLASGWVDVFETQGKASGAYSAGVYGVHPFILLNYQERLNDMFTLAHELGHAMHSYYSSHAQPFVYAHYTIFVAEVASTCNEALLLHHLLQTTDDKMKRAYLLNHQLEGIRATLIRQTMFAEFEKLAHDYAMQGGALTPDWLMETYYGLNQTYYGAACHVDKDIEIEWARIPHFYNAFYVYKYATGISAATALSQKILEEGQPAVERYLTFLKSGGSDYPINQLKAAGVDMTSPEPVRTTLKLFGERLEEFSKLLES